MEQNQDQQKLKQFLEQEYGFWVQNLTEAPRGFFGETWIAETGQEKRFVKIDRWSYHKGYYAASFPVIDYLRKQGIDFIPGVIPDKKGNLCTQYEEGVLGVFEYVSGEHTENYPIGRLFQRLGKIYQISGDGLQLEREDFQAGSVKEYHQLVSQLDYSREPDRTIRNILSNNRSFLEDKESRLLHFSDLCRHLDCPMVITHGDAGGNCIVTPERFTIIDWDYPKLAAPERDTWFFMHRESQVKEIEQAFQTAGFDYELNRKRFAYYCYASLFYYIGEYLKAIGESSGETRERLVRQLEEYFRSSWILEQIACADQVKFEES